MGAFKDLQIHEEQELPENKTGALGNAIRTIQETRPNPKKVGDWHWDAERGEHVGPTFYVTAFDNGRFLPRTVVRDARRQFGVREIDLGTLGSLVVRNDINEST